MQDLTQEWGAVESDIVTINTLMGILMIYFYYQIQSKRMVVAGH